MNKGILVQPVVSEKSFTRSDVGVYTFRVSKEANKIQVKEAVEKAFKVTVEKVNIFNRKGKRFTDWKSGRKTFSRKDFKIAVIKLKSGDTIDLFGK